MINNILFQQQPNTLINNTINIFKYIAFIIEILQLKYTTIVSFLFIRFYR
jgi:hypothetical protein